MNNNNQNNLVHVGFDKNSIDTGNPFALDNLENESFYGESQIVHIGFVISCMTIVATVAILLFQTFDGKQSTYQGKIMGKTQPVGEDAIVSL